MSVELKSEIYPESVCPACGNKLSCGAGKETCWCFDLKLSEESLTELKDKFKTCLCKACLENMDSERKNPVTV